MEKDGRTASSWTHQAHQKSCSNWLILTHLMNRSAERLGYNELLCSFERKVTFLHSMKANRGSIAALILNQGTRETCMVNFMPRPLCLLETIPVPTE